MKKWAVNGKVDSQFQVPHSSVAGPKFSNCCSITKWGNENSYPMNWEPGIRSRSLGEQQGIGLN